MNNHIALQTARLKSPRATKSFRARASSSWMMTQPSANLHAAILILEGYRVKWRRMERRPLNDWRPDISISFSPTGRCQSSMGKGWCSHCAQPGFASR